LKLEGNVLLLTVFMRSPTRARELRSAELLRVGNFQVQIRGKIVAVNWKFIILAIILIGAVVNVSGIVFCMADNLIAVGVANAVSILVGLTLVGCMTPENRWRNIILVAAGVWVTDLLPAAIGTVSLSFSGWMGSIVWYAILAALSGVISLLITAFIKPAAKPIKPAAKPIKPAAKPV
jgi:hypothetical protein